MGLYKIRRSQNYQYYWTLSSSNGQVLITSETYITKDACKNGIASSKTAILNSNFDKKIASNGQYYFNQIANNYQVLGTSEMYNTSFARDNGVEAVKNEAPYATVQDLT